MEMVPVRKVKHKVRHKVSVDAKWLESRGLWKCIAGLRYAIQTRFGHVILNRVVRFVRCCFYVAVILHKMQSPCQHTPANS